MAGHHEVMVVRPMLRPGSVVLRRDAEHLQVGTTPGLILRDGPGVSTVLRLADGVRTADELALAARDAGAPSGATVVAELLGRGALVVTPLGGRRPRLDLRHDTQSARFAATLSTLLSEDAVFEESPHALVVAVSAAEPSRTVFRAMRQLGQAHLPVVLVDDRVRVGPLVLPGTTPCLDCYDLHRARTEPAWAALVPQFGSPRASRPGATSGVLACAAAEVARVVSDLRSAQRAHLAGRLVLHGPLPREVSETTIGFQHRCGCGLLAA